MVKEMGRSGKREAEERADKNVCPTNFGISRRTVLAAPFAAMAAQWARAGEGAIASTAKTPPLPAKAKSLIVLVTQGGMSQMDTFDPKPALDRYHGKTLTPEILPGVGEVRTFFGGK